MGNIWLAFLTGLTTGGISCLAVQGGLLTSAVSGKSGDRNVKSLKWQPVAAFLGAKLVSHAILGFILGILGSLVMLTPKGLGAIQILAGIFMLATAARIADIHPVFRRFVITPPRWSYRLLRKTSLSGSAFAPALVGFLSVIMPCGVTQAMMALAVSTGNPLAGTGIMAAFVLGTGPVFFVLGAAVIKLLERQAFAYIAAGIILIFGLMSINGGLVMRGSIYTLNNYLKAATGGQATGPSGNPKAKLDAEGVQEVTITVGNYGYESDTSVLKAGIPVRLKLNTDGVRSCSRAFTIPDLGIQKVLPETGETVIEFTPKKTGKLVYSCSMGMYSGEFTVQ